MSVKLSVAGKWADGGCEEKPSFSPSSDSLGLNGARLGAQIQVTVYSR